MLEAESCGKSFGWLDFFDRKSQSERHFQAGIEETVEAGQSVREELREEQLAAKSIALSVLGWLPQGADGEVPSLSDVLGADRYWGIFVLP